MYGYEGDAAISATYLENRITDLTSELGDGKEHYAQEAKVFLGSVPELLRNNISKDIEKQLNEITKKYERVGILSGKVQESQRYLEKARAMEGTSGTSVFSLGEFDQMRHVYKSQLDGVRAEAVNLNTRLGFSSTKLINLKKGSKKRQKALDEFGNLIAELMNKNMLLLHIAGAIEENQHFIDSVKLSIRAAGGKD